MKILVLGGTGYAGSAIVSEAASRGHEVTALSRHEPESTQEGVIYQQGSLLDDEIRNKLVADADVVIAALSPRGDMAGKLGDAYVALAGQAAAAGARLIVVGGFGSLRPAEGKARFVERDEFPADYRPEAKELAGVLDYLQSSDAPDELDWLYVSPAQEFGAFNPGEHKGAYRTGGGVAFYDEDGRSRLSSLDLADALVDEAEQQRHYNEHISVAY